MKTAIFLALLAILVSVCVALPTFSFSGSTQSDQPNVGVYGGIEFNDDGDGEPPCYVEYTDPDEWEYNYVAWNIWIDSSNASLYFVRAHATNYTDYQDAPFYLYIYSNWNPASPCQGLYANGLLADQSDDSGIDVFDAVNLVPGTYTIVATTDYEEALFAVQFTPATTVIPITPDLPVYPEYSGPAYYETDYEENLNCSYTDEQYNYNTFTWWQPTSGYFDIYGIAINNTELNATTYSDYTPYLALYSGWITNVTAFQINPCQPNFINGVEEGDSLTGLDYVWLNAGWNYTLVVSLEEIFGSVGVLVEPSTIWLLGNNASFIPADYDTTDASDCTQEEDETTQWVSVTWPAWDPIFVVAPVDPLNGDYWSYFYPEFYLYSGNNYGTIFNPPATCPNLLQVSDEAVGLWTTIGSNYTLILTDEEDYGDRPYDETASHVFILSGPYINTASYVVPPGGVVTTTGSGSGSVTGTPGTTGSVVTGAPGTTGSVTGAPGTTGSVTGVSPATTGSVVTGVAPGTTGTPAGTTGSKGTTTGVKGTTTSGVKGTTGSVTGSQGTTGSSNVNSASTATISLFVVLLVSFALFF